MKRTALLAPVADDGLAAPLVGKYAREKYALLYGYASIFSTSMKNRWRNRVYIDLFAAAGKARLKMSNEIVRSSALLALSVRDPFTRYVFCEQNAELLDALKKRVEIEHPSALADCDFLPGDANRLVEQILSSASRSGSQAGLLCFCFVDPCGMSDLRFDTVRELARLCVDFLVLIPTGMEVRRFLERYVKAKNVIVEGFTGVGDWRERWERSRAQNVAPELFIAELYDQQMRTLGYAHGGTRHGVPIREPQTNLILYHLVFYSRHALGASFFAEAAKYSSPQQELFRSQQET